ncbi:DUF6285 domain-containing protein [Nocardia sp. XZ_19_385]|uniref:DUF6285 domain-containing protein n=1 Tax=Nocardia sp. XZ_19_385 TaxID=2769488 RepID=UPI00188DF902|nr:DUF6285 domain-containing protein [Nocardia sp. XZ_19_385]
MPQDLPAAEDLIDVVARHIAEHTRAALPGARGVEALAAAGLLKLVRGLPIGQIAVLQGVAWYLTKRTRSALHGSVAFETRIAADLLLIAKREIEMGAGIRLADEHRLRRLLGTDGSYSELEQTLVQRLRDPAPVDWEPTLAYLRASAAERLRIANPEYTRTESR